jgi:hypothetical protein
MHNIALEEQQFGNQIFLFKKTRQKKQRKQDKTRKNLFLVLLEIFFNVGTVLCVDKQT